MEWNGMESGIVPTRVCVSSPLAETNQTRALLGKVEVPTFSVNI
jgi:hypothetical protein